eukprot:3348267-Rhodomonas_salina.1
MGLEKNFLSSQKPIRLGLQCNQHVSQHGQPGANDQHCYFKVHAAFTVILKSRSQLTASRVLAGELPRMAQLTNHSYSTVTV